MPQRRVVIPDRAVLGAAVVPKRHRARPPAEAAVEFRCRDLVIEHLQDGVAFAACHAVDARREVLVDEKPLAAGHRMGADNGMQGFGVDIDAVPHLATRAEAVAVDPGRLVPGFQIADQVLDRTRERLIGGVGAGEHRVAADRRDGVQMQDRAHGRLGVARYVGMPFHAGHRLRILVRMDGDDLRVAVRRGCGRMDMQLTEAPAKGLVFIEGHVLAAEKDDLMRHQGIVDTLDRGIAERLRDINAADLGADHRAQWVNLDGGIGHVRYLLPRGAPHFRTRMKLSRANFPAKCHWVLK